MVAASYISDGSKYDVVPTNKVDGHYEVVRELVSDTDKSKYKEAMHDSVEQGMAYEVLRDGEYVGHFYGRIHNDKYHGCSINSVGDRVGTVLLLRHIFEGIKRKKILFSPHGSEGLKRFVSMATGTSIRSWYTGKEYVVITRSSIYNKGKKMYEYLGIEECQQQ